MPPRVDHSLTPLGEQAAEPVGGLGHWAERGLPAVEAARHAYDSR